MPQHCFVRCLIATLLVLSSVVETAQAGRPGRRHGPPPPRGQNGVLAELSAAHWQWLYSLPIDEHPLFDTADINTGQQGNIWFIGGTFSTVDVGPGVVLGEVERTGTIPSGTALFFPLINAEASTIEGNGETEDELRDTANFLIDLVDPDSVFLEIDGCEVNVSRSRVESPAFEFGPLPENNVLASFGYDAPEGATSLCVADGYYALVKPLSVGRHTIHFGGEADFSSVGGPLFILDITYRIRVVPGRR